LEFVGKQLLLKVPVIMILVTMGIIVVPPNGFTQAQPTWENYENQICGVLLKYPYETDIIQDNNGTGNKFQISSMKDPMDPNSMDVEVQVTCIDKSTPITAENMELAKANLLEQSGFVTYEDVSFNRTMVDGEIAGSFAAAGPTGLVDIKEVNSIIETNHNDQSYIVKLDFSGDDGTSGFYSNYKYLEDNIINSIKFLD
jgi:hypothetical protein